MSTCNYWALSRLQNQGNVADHSFFHELDFEIRRGLIVVKARINNSSETFNFIFDTGAYSSTISRELAEQLQLIPKASRKTGDSRGNIRKMEVVQLEEVDLGGLRFQNIAAGIVDFSQNSPIQCIAKDGIIGSNLIRECHWKIDIQQQKMWLTDNFQHFTELKGQNGLPFQHTKKNGKPYIELQLEDYKINNVLIDLGSNGGIDLSARWLKKHPEFLEGRPAVINYDSTSAGLWGRAMDTTKVVLSRSLRIGPHQLTNWRVDFPQKGNPKIGMELLARFNLYFNYESAELFLIPNKPLDDYNLHAFGFVPDFVSPDYFIIRNLFVPSAASEAGLRLGDTLTHINNLLPAQHFQNYCDYFTWASHLLRENDSLSVTKNGKAIHLKKEVLLHNESTGLK